MKPHPIHLQGNLVLKKLYSVFQWEAINTHKTKQHQHKLGLDWVCGADDDFRNNRVTFQWSKKNFCIFIGYKQNQLQPAECPNSCRTAKLLYFLLERVFKHTDKANINTVHQVEFRLRLWIADSWELQLQLSYKIKKLYNLNAITCKCLLLVTSSAWKALKSITNYNWYSHPIATQKGRSETVSHDHWYSNKSFLLARWPKDILEYTLVQAVQLVPALYDLNIPWILLTILQEIDIEQASLKLP
jgi:hypothetical protein